MLLFFEETLCKHRDGPVKKDYFSEDQSGRVVHAIQTSQLLVAYSKIMGMGNSEFEHGLSEAQKIFREVEMKNEMNQDPQVTIDLEFLSSEFERYHRIAFIRDLNLRLADLDSGREKIEYALERGDKSLHDFLRRDEDNFNPFEKDLEKRKSWLRAHDWANNIYDKYKEKVMFYYKNDDHPMPISTRTEELFPD